jgi:hypothetical protein
MVTAAPLASSAPREPQKRPRPIPADIKASILFMVYGDPTDEDGRPLGMIDAAKAANVKPDRLRAYLDRPNVIAFLRAERRANREAICAGNEGSLQRVRDKSSNGMAVVASVRALEQIDEEGTANRPRDPNVQPGVTIRIVNVVQPTPPPAPPMIDITPPPAPRS